jgi:hypothetical protein
MVAIVSRYEGCERCRYRTGYRCGHGLASSPPLGAPMLPAARYHRRGIEWVPWFCPISVAAWPDDSRSHEPLVTIQLILPYPEARP